MSIFQHATEAQITRAMLRRHWKKFDEFTECDVVVVGAGPAGLVASYELAKNGVKTMLVERNNYLGGGMFLGGYGMPEMVVRKPGNFIFDELGISYDVDGESGMCVANAPMAAGKIIAAAAEAGVFIVNLTSCEDLVVNDNDEVAGVVVNWMPVESLPRQITCVDPVAIQSKVVIATTGHDDAALVRRLSHLGMIPETKGMGTMNIRRSEDSVVEHTKEIYPGLIVAGMEAAAAFSLHRMGPTFGAMFVSGKRAAEVAMIKLGVMSEDGKLAAMMK